MKCPECGHFVEKDAQFCPKCFARIPAPGLWQRILGLFAGENRSSRPFIKIQKTVTIKATDKDGQKKEYHSLEELPPALRAEVEKVQSEAWKKSLSASSSDGSTNEIRIEKKVSVFKVKDASGKEQIYHSLDEMPPAIRKAFEKARAKTEEM